MRETKSSQATCLVTTKFLHVSNFYNKLLSSHTEFVNVFTKRWITETQKQSGWDWWGYNALKKKFEKKQTKDMNCQKIYDLGDFDAHF